jgi:hypothetical protein
MQKGGVLVLFSHQPKPFSAALPMAIRDATNDAALRFRML